MIQGNLKVLDTTYSDSLTTKHVLDSEYGEICVVDIACSSSPLKPTGDAFVPLSTDGGDFLFDSYVSFGYGTTLRYQCGPGLGFSFAGDTKEITCGWNGEWSSNIGQCRCEPLNFLENVPSLLIFLSNVDFKCPSLPTPPLVPSQGYAMVPVAGSRTSDFDFRDKVTYECPKTSDGDDTFLSYNSSKSTLQLECLAEGYFEFWPTGAFCYPTGSKNFQSMNSRSKNTISFLSSSSLHCGSSSGSVDWTSEMEQFSCS